MRRLLILRWACVCSFCLLFGFQAFAQTEIVDYMGRPIMAKQYLDVKGSPYLHDEWQEGWVKLKDGREYSGVRLKYDQVSDELMFSNQKGEAQLFMHPVVEFEVMKRFFMTGFDPIDTTPATAYYEVLSDGPTQLLKRTSKRVYEELPYSSATKVKTILAQENYYLANREGKLTKLKKDKKSLIQALGDKQKELETYVKTNRLDLRQEQDMAKLVAYYNSL